MILFKKKLILTALFIVGAGMSIVDNSNATNNYCTCCHCYGTPMMQQQDTGVSQQLVDQTPEIGQVPQPVNNTQGTCKPYWTRQHSSNMCSSQGGFYLHGSFYGNGCNCHGSNCPHSSGVNPHCGGETHGNVPPHGGCCPCDGNHQHQGGDNPGGGNNPDDQTGQQDGPNTPGGQGDNTGGGNSQQGEQNQPGGDDNPQGGDGNGQSSGGQSGEQPSDGQSQDSQSKPIYEPDNFDINYCQDCHSNDEIISGHWRLTYNCIISTSLKMENSIFEVVPGKKFETPFNSMFRIKLKSSTLLVNERAKFVYQSNNFNTVKDGSEVIFGPYSRLIWNGLNYRLFDASDNTSFIIYPKAFINALKFDDVHKHNINYLIDGNNEQSTLYLNRIDSDSPKNQDIMAVVLDMNVVLPSNYNKNNLILDDSRQFLKIDLYPNLYFENCKFSFEDYSTEFDKEKKTNWMIKTGSKDYTGNKKAILSGVEKISNYTSPDGSKFAKYDIDFGYAKVNSVSDNRDSYERVFDTPVPNKYNKKSVTIGEKQYNCYWDLSKLADSFKDGNSYKLQVGGNMIGALNYIPWKLYAGLIGNENIRLFSKYKGVGYDEVIFYGDNKEYTGKVTASDNVNNITFYENSYADIDQLFKPRTDKYQCNCELRGSNEIRVDGQIVNNLVVTKDAKTIKFVPAKAIQNDNYATFTIKGAITFDDYESDSESTDGEGFVVEEGVEVNA